MRHPFLAGVALAATLASASLPAHADASTDVSAISLLPVASVLLGASAVSDAAKTAQAALSTAGTFVVRSVEASGRGRVLVLERVSDGARVSVEVAGQASVVAGAVVTSTVLASGTVLSAAGQVLAFVPNEVGRVLLHNALVVR